MQVVGKRRRLRRVLSGKETLILPVVYDAVSARIAEMAGFEAALLSGSVAAASLHGFPDLVLVTMTEVAQLARRIVDSTTLSLQVDCDNGFGNALNVMRCVREFEAAGAAALTIEDTDLPLSYGSSGPSAISIAEMCGKLEAAVAARKDSEMVIIGRTDTFRFSGINAAIERVRAAFGHISKPVWTLFLSPESRKEKIWKKSEKIFHFRRSLPVCRKPKGIKAVWKSCRKSVFA
jgi:carboxyvinyl-carboxyphosphonate phosphorylmutase